MLVANEKEFGWYGTLVEKEREKKEAGGFSGGREGRLYLMPILWFCAVRWMMRSCYY